MKQGVPLTSPQSGWQPVGLSSGSLALLTAALWGGNPVAFQFTADTLPPIAIAGLRFAMAGVFMLVWCYFEGTSLRLRSGQLVPSGIAGILLFLQITTFNIGVWLSTASHGSMLISTVALWVAVFDHWFGRDRLTRTRMTGMLIAAAGTAVILSTAGTEAPADDALDRASLSGDVILLISAIILGFKVVYVKQALKVVEPGKLIFWHDVVGVALFAGVSLAIERVEFRGFTLPAVAGLVYQGVVVAGLCFAIQAMLLRRHSASKIAVFAFATPLFGVALAVVLRGDPLSTWLLVSAVSVALGIWLVNSDR